MPKFGETIFHLRRWLQGHNCPPDAVPKLILEFPNRDALWYAKRCMFQEMDPCEVSPAGSTDFMHMEDGNMTYMGVEVQFRLSPAQAAAYHDRGPPVFWEPGRYLK